MDYRFLAQSDESLIEFSELPTQDGIALAVVSTGYEVGEDEAIGLAIVDLEGGELFCQTVKPQNVEDWPASDASGGIAPADVAEAQELYQFEDEISDLFENASVVVAAHVPYAESMIEAGWVTLPKHESVDLVETFRATHSSADDPNEPAAAASLAGIADYYQVETGDGGLVDTAREVAACYRALVQEHADERAAKGDDYWRRYEERKAAAEAEARAGDAAYQSRERFLNRMNGALWLVGGIIFASLVIQSYQNGADFGLLVVFGAIAGFCFARGITNIFKR